MCNYKIFLWGRAFGLETNNFSQSPETEDDTSYFHSILHTSRDQHNISYSPTYITVYTIIYHRKDLITHKTSL